MSQKETSIEAYKHCVEKGLISKREAAVLKVISEAGKPMNQTMAHIQVCIDTNNPHLQRHSIGPRFVVLESMGLIRSTGKAVCPFTWRSTLFYEPTGYKPEGRAKGVQAQNRKTIAGLRQENAELRKENADLREVLNMRTVAQQERAAVLNKVPVATQCNFPFGA